MPRPSDPRRDVLTGLLGLGSQSSRKSYYPELLARLEELEAERNRYKWLFENAVHGIFQASLASGLSTANRSLAREVRERLFSVPVVERAGNVLEDSFHERGPRDVRHPLSA